MRNSRRTISEESELVNRREDRVTTHSSPRNANAHAIELLDGGLWLEKHNRGETHRGRLIEMPYIRSEFLGCNGYGLSPICRGLRPLCVGVSLIGCGGFTGQLQAARRLDDSVLLPGR